MKILCAPKKSEWAITFTCASCKAKLEAELADVKNTGYETGDYYHVAFAVPCPLCKEKKELTASEMKSYYEAKLLAKASKKLSAIKNG